jgi:hypothetical protein
MYNYDLVFEKLAEAIKEEKATAPKKDANVDELDEIEQLRRFSADLLEAEPASFTTT